jgi:hypothetical protein
MQIFEEATTLPWLPLPIVNYVTFFGAGRDYSIMIFSKYWREVTNNIAIVILNLNFAINHYELLSNESWRNN